VIVDASALLAILFAEDDAVRYAQAIAKADACRISAVNFAEAGISVDRQAGVAAGRELDTLVRRAGLSVEPVTVEQAHVARQAYLDFGKGNHPAGLNFGDCFAYALARETGEQLLYKGNDFAKTDIRSAL
jgi:ribonuclease VapC